MWAIGRYDLRLTDAEFWDLTLWEFDALMHRWRLAHGIKAEPEEIPAEPDKPRSFAKFKQITALQNGNSRRPDDKSRG